MKMNKTWHLKHKMPKNAAIAQKIKWHEGHAAHCSCRDSKPMLEKLKAELKKRRGIVF